MRTGRRRNLLFGCLGLVLNFALLAYIRSAILGASMETATDFKLGSMFAFVLGVVGTVVAAQGLLSTLPLVQAWRHWNGNLLRRGVIAALEDRDT